MSVFFHSKLRTAKLIIALAGVLYFGLMLSSVYSQDTHYSLYDYSPLFLNPANTGNFNGDWRLSGNFRNQMVAASDPYRTTTVGFDSRVYLMNQKLGVGVFIMNDESGVGGLAFNRIYASIGYQYTIKENHLSAGFQAGYVIGSVNNWGNWNYTTGDFTSPSGETGFGDHSGYLDLNFGIHWKRNIKKVEPEIGFSLSHLNKPNISFTEGEEKESIKWGLNAKMKINISDKLFVQPSFLFLQKQAMLTMLGTNIGYNLLGNKSSVKQITGGVYLRNGLTEKMSTLALCLGTSISRLDIGVGYDMNLGQFSESVGSTGAFEISFIYRSISTVLNSYSIPCERY